jgi:hypothetical protein
MRFHDFHGSAGRVIEFFVGKQSDSGHIVVSWSTSGESNRGVNQVALVLKRRSLPRLAGNS